MEACGNQHQRHHVTNYKYQKRQRIQSNALEGVIHVNVHLNLRMLDSLLFQRQDVPKARR